MKKIILLIAALTLLAFGGCKKEANVSDVRIEKLGPFVATVAFRSDVPAKFTIEYGEGTIFDRSVSDTGETTDHKINITGLKPSTMYTYRIVSTGFSAAFRSGPGSDGAFDLMVLGPQSSACKTDVPDENRPDLLLLTGDCPAGLGKDEASVFTQKLSEGRKYELGKATIYAAPTAADLAKVPEARADRVQIVATSKLPQTVPANLTGAVVVSPEGFVYNETRQAWTDATVAWIEVDAFEVAWAHGDGEQRQRSVIIEAPPETKKSCLYCDRLLESGRYEESIRWYRNFIEENKGHEVEDAWFSIARILDEKLFRYRDAVEAYSDFLARFPGNRKATLARYRLDFLKGRSDHNFEPLRTFEKAKAELVRDNPQPSIDSVEALLKKWPDANVAEDALFWLGNLLQESAPDTAVDHFSTLIKRFPKSENGAMAAIAIGDIYYRDKKYNKAVAAYEQAAQIVPETYKISIADKMRKSHRNIKREIARYGSWALLAFWAVLLVVMKGKPRAKDLWAALIAFALYALIGGIYFAITYEKTNLLVPMMVALFPSMSVVFLWNRALANAEKSRGWLVMLHAVSTSAAVVYLVLYQFHQLYVFGI